MYYISSSVRLFLALLRHRKLQSPHVLLMSYTMSSWIAYVILWNCWRTYLIYISTMNIFPQSFISTFAKWPLWLQGSMQCKFSWAGLYKIQVSVKCVLLVLMLQVTEGRTVRWAVVRVKQGAVRTVGLVLTPAVKSSVPVPLVCNSVVVCAYVCVSVVSLAEWAIP
jgi:hypothetical protein